MTASVSTQGMKGACFTDIEREKMYIETLRFYLNLFGNTNQKIIFAENSGWDLNHIKESINDIDISKIEFISLNPTDFDISKGKGYNELLLINKAIEKSQILRDCTLFFKVTGRYPIYNINKFLKWASNDLYESGKDLFCDIKDHTLYSRLGLNWSEKSFECRLFGIRKDLYIQNIAPLYEKCNDYTGNMLENILFDWYKSLNNKTNITARFNREPIFGGLEGSDIDAISFSKNQNSIKGKLKRFVGNTIRICLPKFKF